MLSGHEVWVILYDSFWTRTLTNWIPFRTDTSSSDSSSDVAVQYSLLSYSSSSCWFRYADWRSDGILKVSLDDLFFSDWKNGAPELVLWLTPIESEPKKTWPIVDGKYWPSIFIENLYKNLPVSSILRISSLISRRFHPWNKHQSLFTVGNSTDR